MSKKTFEEVRAAFNQRGFTLVSEEYKGAHSPLNYRCSNDHQTKISFSNLQSGQGCAECAGLKKKTIAEVEAAFNQRGFTLLSKAYQDAKTPLDYICDQGHQTKISLDSLQRDSGCAECSGKKKKTFEEVQAAFNQKNYTLLSTEYKNNISPLNYICSNRHQTKIRFADLQSGKGCAECGGKKKKTVEEVRELFTARGYTLLSDEYKSNKSLLNYVCSNGHQTKICFSKLQNGQGCAECAEYGFNPSKPAILYYLRFQFEGNLYYKIGITNNTIAYRFQSEKTSYTVIKETVYTLGKEAHTQEQAILKKFSASRYKGKPFLTMRGDTELFTKDVLQLDYEPFQNFAA